MSEEQKNPMWVALLSGAIILGTGPLALAFLLGFSSRSEEGGFSGLAELVHEGGPFSYGILLAGALSSLAAAILAAVSVRRPGLPAPIALLPFLLPMITALLGVVFGMREMMMAIVNVAPADKPVILVAATGEIASVLIQALAFAAAGTLCFALAALLSFGLAPRAARILALVGPGTLGLCLVAMMMQALAVHVGFRSVSHDSPADRMVILAGVIQEWQGLNRISNGLFIASLGIAIVGGALLSRSKQAPGIGTAAMLFVAAIGFRGLNSMTERQLSPSMPAPSPRIVVNGIQPRSFERVDLSSERSNDRVDEAVLVGLGVVSRNTAELFALRRINADTCLGLELTSALETATLRRALQTGRMLNVKVELIGDAPKKELVVPPLFAAAVEAMSQVQLAVPLRVLFPEEECAGCVTATLTEKGLKVGEREWTLGAPGFTGDVDTLPNVEVGYPNDLDSLVRAGLTALSNQHVLAVRVPVPDPIPKIPTRED